MSIPIITYNPFSAYTTPVFPAYIDQTSLVTSPNLTRYSYRLLSDVIINGNKVATLKDYPFNGSIEVNPQNITSNYLLHNFNYAASPILDNPDSIKSVELILGEEYSRTVPFSSVTNYGGYIKLNTTYAPIVGIYDRVYVNLDNTAINPQYNTYGKVLDSGSNYIITDIPYGTSGYTDSGYAYEGSEYFDFGYGNLFVTTNAHNFSVGDSVFLQMDSWSTGKIHLTSGSSGAITQISVGGVHLISTSVSFTTDLPTTLNFLSIAINTNTSTTGISAYQLAGSNRLHLYSTRFNGDATVGEAISITSTGNLSFVYSPSMYKAKGIDNTGEGWNPQLSGQYTIASVPASNTFTTLETVTEYYSNEGGSERGTWYSLNNYKFPNLATGSTYYVMNNKNAYDFADYPNEVTKHTFNASLGQPRGVFLTDKPRTSFNFYSNTDIETLDILWAVNWNGSGSYNGGSYQGFNVKVYSGNSTTYTNYFIDISHYTSGFTGSNIFWKRFSFGVGAYNLNSIPQQYITPTPSGQLINDNVSRYEVYGNNGSFLGNFTETIQFNRQCKGNAFKYYQLIFLNRWGTFDYVPLTSNYEKDLSVERTQFDRKRESTFSTSRYGFNVADRGKTDFYINSSMSIKLYSNWMNLEESHWLTQVYESPQVYLYCPSENTTGIDLTNLYPVNITDTDIKLFNERSRMKQFEFNVMVSNTRINQKN